MTTTLPMNAELCSRVLKPYRANCHYLRDVEVTATTGEARARGAFAIDESCYIDDTGHFNAVEFNICYNQLGYYLLASCVQNQLFASFSPWTMADFWHRQLSDVLIHGYTSRFRRPIDPRCFTGEVVFHEPTLRRRSDRPTIMLIETTCAFQDAKGGAADGQVNLALTNLPDGAA